MVEGRERLRQDLARPQEKVQDKRLMPGACDFHRGSREQLKWTPRDPVEQKVEAEELGRAEKLGGRGPHMVVRQMGIQGQGEGSRHHHWAPTLRLWVAFSIHGGDGGFPPFPHPGEVPWPLYLASQGCRGPDCPSLAPQSPC